MEHEYLRLLLDVLGMSSIRRRLLVERKHCWRDWWDNEQPSSRPSSIAGMGSALQITFWTPWQQLMKLWQDSRVRNRAIARKCVTHISNCKLYPFCGPMMRKSMGMRGSLPWVKGVPLRTLPDWTWSLSNRCRQQEASHPRTEREYKRRFLFIRLPCPKSMKTQHRKATTDNHRVLGKSHW